MQSFITLLIVLSFHSYVVQVGITFLRLAAFDRDDDRIKSVREFIWWITPIIPSVIWAVVGTYKKLKALSW